MGLLGSLFEAAITAATTPLALAADLVNEDFDLKRTKGHVAHTAQKVEDAVDEILDGELL